MEGTATVSISDEVVAVFSEGLASIQEIVFAMVKVALPVGLAIAGLFMGIRLGIGFFRSIAH